jgi:hypothetical protein
VVNLTEEIHKFRGTIMHKILEDNVEDSGLAEKRYYREIEVNGQKYTIGGQVDHLVVADRHLNDWKTPSMWQWVFSQKDGREEWVAQASIYRWILAGNGIEVDTATIWGFMLDWKKSAVRRGEDLPQSPVGRMDIELWTLQYTEDFISGRIKEIVNARECSDPFLPTCDSEERWAKPNVWAVKKKGGKRAINGGLCSSESEAVELINNLDSDKLEIEFRRGENTRCLDFCSVRDFCHQKKGMG